MKLLLIPLLIFLSGCSEIDRSSRARKACWAYARKVNGTWKNCDRVTDYKTGLFGILYEEKYYRYAVDKFVETPNVGGGYWIKDLKRKWRY